MPLCKNDPKRKYKGDEPSPKGLGWCAHGEKEGKVRKGLDGNKWVVKKVSSGSLRWVKDSVNKESKIVKSDNKPSTIDCSKFVIYRKKTKFGCLKIETLTGLSGPKNTLYKYISYNNFEKVATNIPDGFKKSKLTSDITKRYCGNIQFLTKQTAPKINHPQCKKYFTHSNGEIPYLVYVNNKNIYIYEINTKHKINYIDWDYKNYMNNSWMYTQLVKEYKNVIKIYIGKSPKIKMTIFSGGHGKKFDGNTILLQIGKYKYVYISYDVTEFNTRNDDIISYYSPVGNNDVPYPIAFSKNNTYIFNDSIKYISNSDFFDKKYKTEKQKLEYSSDNYFKLEPFFTSVRSNKKPEISLQKFNEIRHKTIDDVSIKDLKTILKMYAVTTSGSNKQELVDRLKNVRQIKLFI